jgi:Ca2+/Na+ antiporter
MAEDSVNYAEYTVTKKAEGTNLRKRIILIAVYLIYIAAVVIITVATKGGGAMWGFLFFLLFVILVFFSWKLVKEDRKYECLNAKLVISELNEGIGSKPKIVSEDLISAYSLIAPTNEEYREQWSNADEIKDFRGDTKSPDSYFARLEKDGKSTVVLFEVTNKMLKVMKFYNSKGTVVTEVRR